MRACPTCSASYDDDVAFCPEDGTGLSAPVDEIVGTMVAAWKVERLLRAGGMGAVYIALHPAIGSRVAIKFLHRRFAKDALAVGRFSNEARATNLIGHENIVKVLDLGETPGGLHYMVMELLEGQTLDVLIRQKGALSLTEAAPIALQCCAGLHAAHERGIIHRDVKPENIFLARREDGSPFVKLLDFGVAKLAEAHGSAVRTRAGTTLGTPWYMSPEQAMGEVVDRRGDIYSLGIILYEMATGRVPFQEKDATGSMLAHLQHEPPKPRSLNAEIAPAYEQLLLKTLEKDRGKRHQTMAELREDIQRCLKLAAQRPPGPRRPAPPPPGFEPEVATGKTVHNSGAAAQLPTVFLQAAPSRRPIYLAAALAALVLIALGTLLFRSRRPGPRTETASTDGASPSKQGEQADNAPPLLTIKSDPPGAAVKASWSAGMGPRGASFVAGSGAGVTPFKLSAPIGASVRLEYAAAGFETMLIEVPVRDIHTTADAQLRRKQSARTRTRRRPAGQTAQPAGDDGKAAKDEKDLPPQPSESDQEVFGDDAFGDK